MSASSQTGHFCGEFIKSSQGRRGKEEVVVWVPEERKWYLFIQSEIGSVSTWLLLSGNYFKNVPDLQIRWEVTKTGSRHYHRISCLSPPDSHHSSGGDLQHKRPQPQSLLTSVWWPPECFLISPLSWELWILSGQISVYFWTELFSMIFRISLYGLDFIKNLWDFFDFFVSQRFINFHSYFIFRESDSSSCWLSARPAASWAARHFVFNVRNPQHGEQSSGEEL